MGSFEKVVAGIQATWHRLSNPGLPKAWGATWFKSNGLPSSTKKTGTPAGPAKTPPSGQIPTAFLLGAVQITTPLIPAPRSAAWNQFSASNQWMAPANNPGFPNEWNPGCPEPTNSPSGGEANPPGTCWTPGGKKRGRPFSGKNWHPTRWAWTYLIEFFASQPTSSWWANAPPWKAVAANQRRLPKSPSPLHCPNLVSRSPLSTIRLRYTTPFPEHLCVPSSR